MVFPPIFLPIFLPSPAPLNDINLLRTLISHLDFYTPHPGGTQEFQHKHYAWRNRDGNPKPYDCEHAAVLTPAYGNPRGAATPEGEGAPRGSKKAMASNAIENHLVPIMVIRHTCGFSDLPRVDPDSPVVYRGELYCRFPGCTVETRYDKTFRLRRHYGINHKIEFGQGRLAESAQKEPDEGLIWLARYVAFGEETAGEAPPKPILW